MARYVYVVTRIVKRDNPWIQDVPNLGVYLSYKKAVKHYNSVVQSRGKEKCVSNEPLYTLKLSTEDRYIVIKRYCVSYKDNIVESLRLEKWIIK